jgi:hypothetical protein
LTAAAPGNGPAAPPPPPTRAGDPGLTAVATGITIGSKVKEMHVHALPRPRTRWPAFGVGRLTLSVRVWLTSSGLDRQLAEGLHPSRSRALSLRARQLTSAQRRRQFAGELESIITDARTRRSNPRDCVQLQRVQICAAEDDLRALAAALRSPARCRPHAAGIVSFLLRDAASPLYYSDAGTTAAELARAASAGFAGP